MEFLYPNRLQRISGLYPDLKVNFLKKFLNAFDRQAQTLTSQFSGGSNLFEQSDLEGIIEEFFLKEDATALLFSEVKKGTYDDADRTLTFYSDQYLSVYEKKPNRDRKDEKYIVNRVEEGLKERSIKYSREIKRDYTVETPYLSQTFDLAWKNGSTNIITPIGLDLKQKESIERKVCTWRGRLDTLQEKAKEDDLKFDLIVSRPTDRSLFKTYDNVLSILEENQAPKEIYELDNVETYIRKLSRHLSRG